MKYIYLSALLLIIGFVGLVVYTFITLSREIENSKKEIPYLERQIELQHEIIDEPPAKKNAPAPQEVIPNKGKG